jgi:hypothetical protein
MGSPVAFCPLFMPQTGPSAAEALNELPRRVTAATAAIPKIVEYIVTSVRILIMPQRLSLLVMMRHSL